MNPMDREIEILILVSALLFGGLGLYIASQKHRSLAEGWILGAMFGPVGCIIAALLPAKQPPRQRDADQSDELGFEDLNRLTPHQRPVVSDADVEDFLDPVENDR